MAFKANCLKSSRKMFLFQSNDKRRSLGGSREAYAYSRCRKSQLLQHGRVLLPQGLRPGRGQTGKS